MDLTAVLTAAQSPDAAAQKQAEQQLDAQAAANFPLFLGLLATELASEAKPEGCRRLAGILLKNAVYSDNEQRAVEKAALWAAVDPSAKTQIRAALLATLGSPVRACAP